ncbi:protein SRC2 homolog [Mercurialis annua]|uniref:protein SRC2 homolog n=1 Tax=Mercurialis annua TaxID=3986 RepID=UPI00215E0C49|nr:protein SRC2 homolog [Mercurialis annua]
MNNERMNNEEEPPPPGVVVTTGALPISVGPILPPIASTGGGIAPRVNLAPPTTGVPYDITPPPLRRGIPGQTQSPWGYYTPQYQAPLTYPQSGWYPGYPPWNHPSYQGYQRPVQPIPFPSLDTEGTVTSTTAVPPYVPQGVPLPPLYHDMYNFS